MFHVSEVMFYDFPRFSLIFQRKNT